MPKKIEVTGYLFDELTPAEQKKVIEKYRDFNDPVYEQDSRELIAEREKELEKEWGIEGAKIEYSGFGSQGDGASITGDVDVRKFLNASGKLTIKEFIDNVSAILRRTGPGSNHYVHSNTVRAEIEYNVSVTPESNKLLLELEKILNEFQHEQAHKIYRELDKLYFDLTSDEQIAEGLRMNEYLFEKGSWRIL
jgi:hypothetical protein